MSAEPTAREQFPHLFDMTLHALSSVSLSRRIEALAALDEIDRLRGECEQLRELNAQLNISLDYAAPGWESARFYEERSVRLAAECEQLRTQLAEVHAHYANPAPSPCRTDVFGAGGGL